MNTVIWHMWAQACAEKAIDAGARHCAAKQCFVSVSWLAQQVFYLPCSATAGTQSQNGQPRRW
jgi:hypothetical protein